ncbi:Homoserine kinase [Lacticaseibacillus pantheris DSM 15945 = JCM 12539 = NBRC 106106]|uniref:Homoserine kinase n=1 Tax=Lacticaseibacillus pantheris DSM 15945 = JCM 12539 = NBRC 106106 TaxID=1423783 RepID=A0A0R1U3G2_9LACO|nr:homoserine kinase [Lacticaseibacillus pantheris]KRL87849.1 Homoserine kinase [Lacticaseibacillus pantheris DSM 15945 = JCM 12539 = NBRC 106106]
MINVKVPASSANLGVGYDVLGLAVNMYLHASFATSPDGRLHIHGGDARFHNADNLIYQAFRFGARRLHATVPPLTITTDADMPAARGLGSSAACIVAGLEGANQLYRARWSRDDLLAMATEMEGHPDNVAPAIFGQLCATIMNADGTSCVAQYALNPNWRMVVLIPNVPVSTNAARSILPHTLSYADASYQMGRCTLMTAALSRGDAAMLGHAATDKMQEPYRARLIPEFAAVRQLATTHNAVALISGSGSTMLAIAHDAADAYAIAAVARQQWPQWQVRAVQPDAAGVTSTVAAQAVAE